jgi:GDP-4-dehydro-6-deoxy-D-mannose reductase
MKIMITGAAGFIGGFLAKRCLDSGYLVLGLGISEPANWYGGSFEHCDVRNADRLAKLVTSFQPDRIFHLAAQSYPTVSLEHPRETLDINMGGTVNLFECVRTLPKMPMTVVACSSAEYGPVAPENLPVREEHPLQPLHPYGVSKVGQDLLAAQYFANYKIPCVRIRIFNTTGPGKLGDVCSDLTRRAVEIELGLRAPLLMVGNRTRRAIIDVRDLVRGLCLSAECCAAGGVYNLGANQIYSIQQIIEAIQKEVKQPFVVQEDPLLVRGCDEPVIAGDISKFQQCSGWKPEVSLSQTLEDMLAWWRKELSVPSGDGTASNEHSSDRAPAAAIS